MSDRTVPKEAGALRSALGEWAREALREASPPTNAPPSVLWSVRVTPPVCASWPPIGDGRVYVYAFAAGMRTGLSDAEVVSHPFARFLIDVKTGKARMEPLGALRELGIQGVHPASAADIAAWKEQAASEQRVLKLSLAALKADPANVRNFYCMWMRNNGVIAREVAGRHSAFFEWLGCGR